MENLPAEQFMQVHRSYVVNLEAITGIRLGENTLEVAGKLMPVSKSYKGCSFCCTRYRFCYATKPEIYTKVIITCPNTFSMWELSLRFEEEQTKGAIFDEMDMQLAAIASLHGMEGVFQIKSALICEVERVKSLYMDESLSHG
ncbi:MAG: LytTR family DNA-binding domain-containing protein [Cyclobacteriaceae bacterium]